MVINAKNIEKVISHIKEQKKAIVLVGGCFDILHEGHTQFLSRAKNEADVLIVLLESDENIKRLKGNNRPIHPLNERAQNLEKLESVDIVALLSPKTSDKYYYDLTKLIQPDIIAVTNNDPLLDIKKDQAKKVGGKVKIVMDRDTRFSSTELIKKL